MNHFYSVIAVCTILSIVSSVAGQVSLPIKLPPLKSSLCPAVIPANFTDTESIAAVNRFLTEKYGPCGCGGRFERAIYLNMSDPSMQCPSNWRLFEGAVRGCRPTLTGVGCSSAIFPTSVPYNRVCGRITGYQHGTPDAFDTIIGATLSIEEHYVDGVSLTYGAPGSRRHIWTFAAALYYPDPNIVTNFNCKCTNTNYNLPFPTFVGNNYFCESGSGGLGLHHGRFFPDDPLWDGQGCPSTSTCCEFNRPPWFCASLPQTTTEDLEIRLCKDQPSGDEDIVVSYIDILTSNI